MNTTTARELLSAALQLLMQQRPDLDTQVKVAKAAGLSQATVHRILNKSSNATVDNLESLAAAFDIPISELLEDVAADRLIYDKKLYAELSEADKASIQRYISFVLNGATSPAETQRPDDDALRTGNIQAARREIGEQTLNITPNESHRSTCTGTGDSFPHQKIQRKAM